MAAHCVSWSSEGGMVIDSKHGEAVETVAGKMLTLVWAVEPCCHVAVLGPFDEDQAPDSSKEYGQIYNQAEPIPISTAERKPFDKFRVYIRAHDNRWITAVACQTGVDVNLFLIEDDGEISPGTSGGPIVDEQGQILAVVSNSGDIFCSAPKPHRTLPVWVVEKMTAEECDV